MSAVHLDEASVEAVATRVADLLRRGEDVAGVLVDPAEVARQFGVSRDFVYSHADDLGAVRLGSGPRARMRLDPNVVAERLAGAAPTEAAPQKRPSRRKARPASTALLPVKGGR